MATNRTGTPAPLTSLGADDRLELANRLYLEYRMRCFWHCPPDLVITEDLIPFVAKGLRHHGGRQGFILAAKLSGPAPLDADSGEAGKCR